MHARAESRLITVALAGQPNVGKSTVFNLLTGLSQHVANWPGKTSEQKTGRYRCENTVLNIVDLPGTYSLTANSPEERIARDYIIQDRPDVVVAIVDAAALERNLYLLAELLYLPVPIVIGLNRMDLAAAQGIRIEPHVLEAALGLPVVPMVATRNQGVRELMDVARQVACQPYRTIPNRPGIREDHRVVLDEAERLIVDQVPAPYPVDWVALKLLEGDGEITRLMRDRLGDQWEHVHAVLMQHDDAGLAVASGRYEWIGRMIRAAVFRPTTGPIRLTDRLDRLLTHRVWGLLILLAILAGVFWLTYAVGAPLQRLLDVYVVQTAAGWVQQALAGSSPWLVGFLADGLIGGVGTVLTFLPVLFIFFAVLGFLEDVGYIARAAYVMDGAMHLMGLHGQSFLPLFLGLGCNVPAVMATRTIDSAKSRLLTILLAPLVPCPARLAVIAVLTPIFFGSQAPWVAWGLVGLSFLVLALIGYALHELVLGGEHVAFIMELPLYHGPDLRAIGRSIWRQLSDFLRMAGSIIVIVSIALWALYTLPNGEIDSSYLATVGRALAPLGTLMGLGWRMMVALLTSFVRKENTIATLGVLYGGGQEGGGLATALAGAMTPAAALAFLVVQMLFVPCVATMATMRQETGSWRWTLFSIALLLAISFALGILTYQVAQWLGL